MTGGGVKWPDREVDIYPPSGAKSKNDGSYRPTSGLREGLQGVGRATFNFNFLTRK